MKSRDQRQYRKRDRHFLDPDGMVACNPRDREASHRAEVEGIATEDPDEVTCRKCLVEMARIRKGDSPRFPES